MAKQIAKKRVPKRAGEGGSLEPLRKALTKRKKAELVEVLVDVARRDRQIRRQLESRFGVQRPVQDLVASTRYAIADATDFDEREMNYNFAYDHQAYQTVQRNLQRLVKEECFEQAMDLSLELMSKGSYQVEMSDEGMMTDELEACLKVVLEALQTSNVPPERQLDWCDAMTKADRTQFVCDAELRAMRNRLAK